MTAPIILAEKLRRPEPTGLPRPRLEEPLLRQLGPVRSNGSWSSGGVNLVVAPPGSGKTTLLARVAAAASVPVAWFRVTSDESSVRAFVAHLARSLQAALGIDQHREQHTHHDRTEPAVVDMNDLLATLDRLAEPALLILDDLHEIGGSLAERALERFLTLRPPELRVLIGSRRLPDINVPRLRVSGTLHEIGSDDLRFRSWEVEELFFGIFGEPLSPESAAALTRRTGGWAAALQLFHLSTAGRTAGQRAEAVADLGGRSRLIRSYLARNVIDELPTDRRRFLILTSTLGTLTGALCDALLDITGSAMILDELEQRQMFTSSDDDGRTFRYHEVLRTHLELTLVEEYGSGDARVWYARSAALLEEAGEQRAAVRAYARAEDWSSVTRLIRHQEFSGSSAGGAELLLPPGVLETDPWLALVEARRRMRAGSVMSAIEAFRKAEALLDEPDFRERCRRERWVAGQWAPGSGPTLPGGTSKLPGSAPMPATGATAGPLRSATTAPAAPILHWTATIRAATKQGGQAVEALHPGPEWRLAAGVCALLAGDLSSAAESMAVVAADHSAGGAVPLLARLAGAAIALVGGVDESEQLGAIAADADSDGLPWIARLARGLHELVLVSVGAPAWRVESSGRLPEDCDAAGDPWGAALLRMASGVAGLLRGAADAGTELDDAASRFDQLDAPVLRLWVQALAVLHRTGERSSAVRASAIANEADRRGAPGIRAVALAVLKGDRDRTTHPEEVLPPSGTGPLEVVGRLLDRRRHLIAVPTPECSTPPLVTSPTEPPTPPPDSHPEPVAGPIDPARRLSVAVRVRCFGGLQIEVDGTELDLSALRPLPRALLRLLALNSDQDLHRERLIDLFWPDADVTAGTRRLQVAVSSIRQVWEHADLPGSEIVRRHGDAYRFSLPPGGSVDTLEFEDALRRAEHAGRSGDLEGAIAARETALEIYRGDLLPEDGPAEQVVNARDRLRLAAATAAAHLAHDQRTAGRPDQALAAARRSVELDPYQDICWELLADLYESAGDHSAARRTRREHSRAQAELAMSGG